MATSLRQPKSHRSDALYDRKYAYRTITIGRLGWSGNLLTKEYGALVGSGSVLTSATLTPDTPMPDEEHPCDRCKMCCLVCPVEMIHPKASTQHLLLDRLHRL
jgi:epoxyqueuosine reductase QueG